MGEVYVASGNVKVCVKEKSLTVEARAEKEFDDYVNTDCVSKLIIDEYCSGSSLKKAIKANKPKK